MNGVLFISRRRRASPDAFRIAGRTKSRLASGRALRNGPERAGERRLRQTPPTTRHFFGTSFNACAVHATATQSSMNTIHSSQIVIILLESAKKHSRNSAVREKCSKSLFGARRRFESLSLTRSLFGDRFYGCFSYE